MTCGVHETKGHYKNSTDDLAVGGRFEKIYVAGYWLQNKCHRNGKLKKKYLTV